MSGQLLKAGSVRLEGVAWVDTGTHAESRGDQGEFQRSSTALALFRRRIEALRAENTQLRAEMAALRESVAERQEQSRAEGHLLGLEEGRLRVEDELLEAFHLLEIQSEAFRAEAARYHEGADRELVALARWLAEQVLRRELPLDEERLARQVAALLEACLDQQVLRLHLHPGDRRRLLGEELLERLPRLRTLLQTLQGRLEWVEAADVPPGACRVELHDGLLDAAPAGMLDHLEQSLVRALEARQP
ncbi:MAG: FliH/SctL family protein [Candidatus Delongbacteria bacterium]